MKPVTLFVIFLLLCFLFGEQPEPEQQPTPQPTAQLIAPEKIDKFYTRLAKLDKWYKTTKRMPGDAQLYREKLEELIQDTEK
jgi:hypothetical protein